MSAGGPPRLIRVLLRLLVRGEGAEFVLGDVEEGYRERVVAAGRAAAGRWYRRESLATVWSWWTRDARIDGESWARDARLAGRSLLRAPAYSTTTVATLALGLGGVAVVAALSESLLRPLPYPEPDRLVAVWQSRDGRLRSASPADYLDWRRTSSSFAELAAYDARSVSITVDGNATRERIGMVSGNFFAVLGAQPVRGRAFDPGLDPAYPDRVAVLAHAAWRAAFDGADVVGRTILVDDLAHEIVGVAPAGLDFPEPGLFAWVRSPSEAPEIRGFEGDLTQLRDAWYFEVVGRLARGVDPGAAQAEMDAVAARLAELHPRSNGGMGVTLVPLLEQTVADVRPMLWALALAVGLLLVASAVNVAHLALARSAERAPDAAVRQSLGARPVDLARPLLLEGALLGLGGATVGLLFARWGAAALVLRFGATLPRAGEVQLRPAVIAAALAVGLGVGAAIAAVAFARTRPGRPTFAPLRASGTASDLGRRALVGTQVAAAVALLSGAALLARSVANLSSVDPGFAEESLVTLRVALPDARARSYDERVGTFRSLAEAMRSLPGVRSVGFGSDGPLQMGARAGVQLVGTDRSDDPPGAGWQPVDPAYFDALGVAVLRGRGFTEADAAGAPDVAVVNEAFVAQVLGGGEALGTRVTMGLDGHDRPLTIVGVTADTRTRGPAAPAGAVLFRPVAQTLRYGATAAFYAVRTAPEGGPGPEVVAARVREVAPGLPVYLVGRGTELTRPFRQSQAALLVVIGVFATTALLLGMVGVAGVALHTVQRRRREIGVRMALGADRGRVVGDVVRDGLRQALPGVPLGLLVTLGLGRALAGALFGVTPSDPATLAAVSALVVGVTVVALLVPARRAAATDPSEATRA